MLTVLRSRWTDAHIDMRHFGQSSNQFGVRGPFLSGGVKNDWTEYFLVLYHAPHPDSLVRSVNFLEFVTPKQNSETVVVILRANCLQPPFSIFDLGSFWNSMTSIGFWFFKKWPHLCPHTILKNMYGRTMVFEEENHAEILIPCKIWDHIRDQQRKLV